jgi:hypothetical protein
MAGALYFLLIAVVLILLGLFVLTPVWIVVVAVVLVAGWFVVGGALATWAAGRGPRSGAPGTPTTEDATYDPTRLERRP